MGGGQWESRQMACGERADTQTGIREEPQLQEPPRWASGAVLVPSWESGRRGNILSQRASEPWWRLERRNEEEGKMGPSGLAGRVRRSSVCGHTGQWAHQSLEMQCPHLRWAPENLPQ